MSKYKNILVLASFSILILLIAIYSVSVSGDSDNGNDIVISEICIKNEGVIYDTNGKYGSDYIEIYNCSDRDIDLSGYGLSDNNDDPYRWSFPEIILPQGECLILFGGTAEDIFGYYNDDYVSPMIGFGFKFGEVCILTDGRGEQISRVIIPYMESDTSYQITSKDVNNYFLGKPSPGYVSEEVEPIVKKPAFTDNIPLASAESGFYDNELYVTLSSENSDDVIYYTLDGSVPNEFSDTYDGPILIKDRTESENIYSSIADISLIDYNLEDDSVDKCTLLKAVAVDKNGAVSRCLERVYFVGFSGRYGIDGIPVMSISCDPDDMFSYDRGIYVLGGLYDYALKKYYNAPYLMEANYYGEGKDWERRADITYWDKAHETCISQTVGLRIHGRTSRKFNQKGFGLYAGSLYGDYDYFEFDPFGNGNKYNRLVLQAGGDLYNTKMRDAFVHSLVTDRSAGYLDSEPCAVFLNGEYWGLYLLQEKIGNSTVSNHYAIPEDDIYVVKHWNLIGYDDETDETVSRELWDSFDVIEENDMSSPEVYIHADSFMDMQSFIDFCCIEIYIANYDWWGVNTNNTAFWRSNNYDSSNPYSDMKWRAFLYDLGASQNLYGDNTSYDYDSFGYSLEKCGVLQSLLQNSEFRRRFVTSFMDIANDCFEYEKVHDRLYEMAEIYREPVVLSQNRWRGDYSEAIFDEDYSGIFDETEFDRNIFMLDDFYRRRFAWMAYYLGADLELKGELVTVNLTADEGFEGRVSLNTIDFEYPPVDWSGQYFTDYPIVLACCPDDENAEIQWVVNGTVYSDSRTIELDLGDFESGVYITVKYS